MMMLTSVSFKFMTTVLSSRTFDGFHGREVIAFRPFFSHQRIIGPLDVGGGKRFAVMPFHAIMQMEGQRFVVVGKLPAFRQIRQDVIVGSQLDRRLKTF